MTHLFSMTTQYDVLILALNELIEINNSRIDGYKKATDDMDGGDLKGIFQGMIHESEGFAEALTEHVIKFDGEPATESTVVGKIHQAWLDFKALIVSDNRETILSSCEFGDKSAIEVYETTLSLEKVKASPELENLLMAQKSSISESLKIIQSLKSSSHDAKEEQKVLENQ
ncbi:PA2169 family four-helix-bundle protein [Arcicella sp. LKC2W]|uniref:ferritin-like domain-containing protein n=1 Tax=Arcicella sp. LKC2W TaxID=2984198 RepID=UPI002B220941|nr:PA2169 family four-helix-bundle protein [Arcicella sp. LKC2W]MEA5461541.1 PA2169 family four-helix-bundle protein [Arcicella sp. LKC2W]